MREIGRLILTDVLVGVGTALALAGVAACLGFMFRIFKWAAGL